MKRAAIASKAVLFKSFIVLREFFFLFFEADKYIIRSLYDSVKAVAVIIIKEVKKFINELKDNSKIKSLEKNPVRKGKPHKEILVVIKIKASKGLECLNNPDSRLSCLSDILWIIKPAAIKRVDLKRACIIK